VGPGQGRHQGVEAGLRGEARHGGDGASTTSTPALAAASKVATPLPAVSWVWRCMGRSDLGAEGGDELACLRGAQEPAMSLMASMCAPARRTRPPCGGSSRGCSGRVRVVQVAVKQMATCATFPARLTSSMEVRMAESWLKQSKMRKTSTPPSAASCTKRRTTFSG
jgi:hypothetical protein